MDTNEIVELNARLARLERKNKTLTGLCLLSLSVPLLALCGWQSAVPDVLRARRVEVVDERGVPLVSLAPAREGEGGSVTLRDRQGERRAWWSARPDGAAFAATSGLPGEREGHTLGMSVGGNGSQVVLIGPNGESLAASVEKEGPRLDLRNASGGSLFSAPWAIKGRSPKRP
jgi:hypothetical protein